MSERVRLCPTGPTGPDLLSALRLPAAPSAPSRPTGVAGAFQPPLPSPSRNGPCLEPGGPGDHWCLGPAWSLPGPHRVMSTAVSWLATPFSGMALPWPLRLTMDFCHLQKLSRDFPAWWVISRVGCGHTEGSAWVPAALGGQVALVCRAAVGRGGCPRTWSSVSRMRRVTRMLTMFPRLESWKSLATWPPRNKRDQVLREARSRRQKTTVTIAVLRHRTLGVRLSVPGTSSHRPVLRSFPFYRGAN